MGSSRWIGIWPALFACAIFVLERHNAEGSHNGSAAVLKTADRKVMQVRVLSPPPFSFNDLPQFIRSSSIRSGSHLARIRPPLVLAETVYFEEAFRANGGRDFEQSQIKT